MATTKITGKQIKFTTAQAFTGSGGAVSNGMIFDNGVGLVLSGMRIYTAQLTPDSNNEVASKKYVDDNIGGGDLQSSSIAFGQIDGSGSDSDGNFQFLTGSAGFGGGLFYGDMQAIGDSNGPKIRAALTDGAIPGVGTGSIAFNVARVYLTGSAQVALKSGDNLVLEAADDVTLTTTSADGEIQLVTAHTAGVAVFIDADANAGSIVDIDAGILDIDVTGDTTIDAGGVFSVDAVGASNVTTNGALTISGSTGLNLKSDGGTLDIETRVGAIDIDAATTIDIDGAGGINIGKAADVAIDIDSAALDIDASGAITIDGTSTFSVDGVGTSNVTTKGALTISGSTALNLASDSGQIDITSRQGVIDINATAAGITLDAAGASNFTTTSGQLTLAGAGMDIDATGAGALALDGAGGINIGVNADVAIDIDSAALDIDASGAITIDGTTTFSVDAVGTSNVTTNGALTISGSTGLILKSDGGTLDIETRVGAIDIDSAGALTLDSSAGAISIGADDIDQAINIGTDGTRTITIGESADSTISIKSKGGTFTLDGAGQTVDLNSAALDIDASGAITIDGSSTFSVDAVGTSNVTTNGALTISGSTGLSLGADTGVITVSSRNGYITGSALGVLIGSTAADMTITAATTLGVSSGGAMSIAAADGGISISTGADDAVNLILGNDDGGESFAVRNSGGTAALTVDSGLSTTFGAGTVDISAAAALLSPAYVDNCASVTAPASGSTGYTNGTVVNGTGIAEIYYSGSLHNGQSIFLTGGLGPNSLYSNSLRVFNNGILLLSGASNDYTANVILTGASNAYGALRVDFVAQPLVDGDVLQFHARAKLAV